MFFLDHLIFQMFDLLFGKTTLKDKTEYLSMLLRMIVYIVLSQELQEMLLKCREDLITARVGQERAEAASATQRQEAQMYLTQSEVDQKSWSKMQNSMTVEISRLQYVNFHY